jgi:hypothetical protein
LSSWRRRGARAARRPIAPGATAALVPSDITPARRESRGDGHHRVSAQSHCPAGAHSTGEPGDLQASRAGDRLTRPRNCPFRPSSAPSTPRSR